MVKQIKSEGVSEIALKCVDFFFVREEVFLGCWEERWEKWERYGGVGRGRRSSKAVQSASGVDLRVGGG